MSGQPTFGQQPDLLLSRIFTGHPVGRPAMGYGVLNATVTQATTVGGYPAVIVQVGDFGKTSTTDPTTASFSCLYEPRFGSGSTPKVPPAGTQCLVAFATNSGPAAGWVLAFAGWPT